MAEAAGDWELLAPRLTLEDPGYTYGNTLDLLSAYPNLAGLYVAGGGIEGVIQALQEWQRQGLPLPTVVCHDLTTVTRDALKHGLVQAVLSHPREQLARRAVDALVAASLDNGQPGYELLPLQLDVPECH